MLRYLCRRPALACLLLAVVVFGVLALRSATRGILRLQLREAIEGIVTARVNVTNANPEDLHSDVWDVESLDRLQRLETMPQTLVGNRGDWRTQLAVAAERRSHGPYNDLSTRRIISSYERAIKLAPEPILARSDLVLWLCGSQLHYVRPETASAYRGVEMRKLDASPEFIELADRRLTELRALESGNALWPVLHAYLHFGLHDDEAALSDLRAAARCRWMSDHILHDSLVIAQVNEARGLPSYEAKMAAIASQVFLHWQSVTNTLLLAGLLADVKEQAGDLKGAAEINSDIMRIAVVGRDTALYALQADVMAGAIEPPYRHALDVLGPAREELSGPDELADAEQAAVIYFNRAGRPDLAEHARDQLSKSYELSYAIRMGSGLRSGKQWAEWNSSWFRPMAMWGGSVLLLGQVTVIAAIWLIVALIAWLRSLIRLPELVAPERQTTLSVVFIAIVPALSAPLVLLWNSWHIQIAWPASQTQVVTLAGGWFLSFVGVCALPLVTLFIVSGIAAAWRRYRRMHLNVGFAIEMLAIVREALPYALVATLVIYALSLIPLIEVRSQAEILVDRILSAGEMSLLR